MRVSELQEIAAQKEKDKKYHVLFVPTLSSAIAYYRMEQFVRELRKDKEMSIAYTYHNPNFNDTCSWEWNLNNKQLLDEFDNLARCADLIIFQAIHSQGGASLIRALAENYDCKVFSEFDDDPYNVSSQHPEFLTIAPGSKPELFTDDQLRHSSGVIVTTDYLRGVFKEKNENVHVIPNALDFSIWDNLKIKKSSKYINIGFVGGANHNIDLELVEGPINRILDKYKNVRFVIKYGGEVPEAFQRSRVIVKDFKQWSDIKSYPQDVADLRLDIGIAPLRDLRFNRCKSNLKYLEYSALKIPTIASPVMPYLDTLALHARDEDEWFEKLSHLIEDKKAREYYGQESYKHVRNSFSVDKVAKQYNKLIRKVLDK